MFMVETSASRIETVYNNLKALQLIKNKNYGDSALHPIKIFSKASSNEQLKARLDDKLSRIANGGYFKNDIVDIVGYLVLLLINEEWTEFKDLID